MAKEMKHSEPIDEVEERHSDVAVDSKDEIAEQEAAELPDREAMSLVNANVAAPVNLAAALNVASDNSIAYANAEQDVTIDQSN